MLPTEQVHEGKKIHSNGDNSSVKVKVLISDVIAKLEEKASADATHKTSSNVCTAQVFLTNMAARYAVYHRTDGLKTIVKRVQGVSQLFASELISPLSSADLVKAFEAKHINFDETYYPEDVCSLQPINGVSGEYANSFGDHQVPGEHQTGVPKCVHYSEASARYEPRQHSDAAHQHEDQVD